MRPLTIATDSPDGKGGRIPGSPGIHAFSLSGPNPSAVPVLLAVPHAGRAYTGSVLRDMRNPEAAALKLEDRYVDQLALEVSRSTGAAVLIANAPRALIDLNRAPDEVDWDMFNAADRPEVGSYTPSRRARSGLGLIPRRLPGIGELWKRRFREADLVARVTDVHEPYHACLDAALLKLRERWGAAILLDLHSMPPVAMRGFPAGPEFVLGDRFGATCHGSLVAGAFAYFAENDSRVAHNRPYAGGYVLERHARPTENVHAIQLEIDRTAYLDSAMVEPGEGFARIAQIVSGLVRRLAAEVSVLAGNSGDSAYQEAAE